MQLYTEFYKTLLRKIKTNKCLWIGRCNIIKMKILQIRLPINRQFSIN